MNYSDDPIRRWLQRQQDDNWIQIKGIAIGLAVLVGLILLLYLTNFPLEME